MNWLETKEAESFLSHLLLEQMPFDTDIDMQLRGCDSDEIINDHCIFLAKLCKYLYPDNILEIGTYDGKYTSVLGKNSNGIITTVDDRSKTKFSYLYVKNELQNRVRQLFSKDYVLYNPENYYQGDVVDIVVITVTDSLFETSMLGYNLLRPGGVMMWDNIRPEMSQNAQVRKMSKKLKEFQAVTGNTIISINNTGWALLQK